MSDHFSGILIIASSILKKIVMFQSNNYFKPLIDAYHGPFKDNFFYWTGVQLLIRVVVFGLSVLDNTISFLSITVLFAVFFCIRSLVNPFRSTFQNIQEGLILLKLTS